MQTLTQRTTRHKANVLSFKSVPKHLANNLRHAYRLSLLKQLDAKKRSYATL